MKRTFFFIGVSLLVGMVSPRVLFAQRKITIKLASLVPENTPWGAALNQMSKEWAEATNGQVELRVYHGGTLGDEPTMLRLLKQNNVQGVVFTSFGIKLIIPEILTLSVPFFIRNDEELAAVLHILKPELEAKINEKAFFTLAWAKSGWVKIFSKTPVFVPGDLKRQKVATNQDAEEFTQAFTSMGYRMVPVNFKEILIALNSGTVEAVYQSPVYVGGMQIFGVTKNMASINLAPFMGGIILNQRAWQSIPGQYRPRLQAISQRIAGEIDATISKLEADVVKTMTTYGLVVNQVSPEQEQLWYNDMERVMPTLLGPVFDRDLYNKIDDILKKYRNGR